MSAKVANPRKQFQFTIILPGLNPFLAQEVKTPDGELDIVEHGDTGFLVKTAGMRKISTLTVNKIKPAEDIDIYIKIWQKSIMNTTIGGGLFPSLYKKTIIVEQFSTDGISVVERFTLRGCWPQKINGIDFNRKGSDNTIEMLEFCVDEDN